MKCITRTTDNIDSKKKMSWTQHAPQAELTDVLNDTSLVTSTGLQVTAISGNLVDFQVKVYLKISYDSKILSARCS